MFFFFKQKTAYEMRIIDWSSDVCSSDLHVPSGEVEMLDVPDRQFLAALAEIDAVAGGPGGRHRGHLVRRKLALRQDVQHFAPDRSEERRVGQESVSTCSSRWSRYH